ncbi:phosphate transporter [Burkholderiales bacterium GJ-E10]|nr:phosphate transporter [Burkholderiales bacterium GJ-E10]
MIEILLLTVALAVAFGNGANDNFKGFATVWGSETLPYRRALALATGATVAGSLASIWLAHGLIARFSGIGLVPPATAGSAHFLLSVAVGAAVTVALATRLGLPVSTTHALIGGLIGAGLGQAGGVVHLSPLVHSFVAPLLVSPLVAAALGALAGRMLKRPDPQADCACVVAPASAVVVAASGGGAALAPPALPHLVVAAPAECDGLDTTVRVSVSRTLDRAHVASAASICFARGVNDTPKLTALLLAAHALDASVSVAAIGGVMGIGGLLFARRVAETMSRRVTRIGHRDGLGANLVTAALVLFASKLGMPVSTTHVAVGSITGIGAAGGTLDRAALRNILLSWVATLPLAAVVAYAAAPLASAIF